jgi:membrane protein involved in colicin uptake
MQTTLRALLGAALVVTAFSVAVAKLPPAPPLTPEQKAEKDAKDKAAADTAKAQLARAEDKAVANYVANQKAKGAPVNVPMPTGATAPATGAAGDSGGGTSLPAQPEKASNAHSPPKK